MHGRYSWRIVREEYQAMTSVLCEEPYDTAFTFNALQDSGLYET